MLKLILIIINTTVKLAFRIIKFRNVKLFILKLLIKYSIYIDHPVTSHTHPVRNDLVALHIRQERGRVHLDSILQLHT